MKTMASSEVCEGCDSEGNPGIGALLDTFGTCYWSDEYQSRNDKHNLPKVHELDILKRKRNEAYQQYLKDVCIPLWRECYLPDDPDALLISNEEASKSWKRVVTLQKKFASACKIVYSEKGLKEGTDLHAEFQNLKISSQFPCIFYEAFWFPENRVVSSNIEWQKSNGNVQKDRQLYDEDRLISAMELYYPQFRGVHRVPSVMFHVDSWKVKPKEEENKKFTPTIDEMSKPIYSQSQVKQPNRCKSPADVNVARAKKMTDGYVNASPLVERVIDLSNTLSCSQTKLNFDKPVCGVSIGCKSTSRTDSECDESDKTTLSYQSVIQKEGNLNKMLSDKTCNTNRREGKINAESPPQRQKAKDELVTNISLARDTEVKERSVKELTKLSENQYSNILRKRKELNAVDMVASFLDTFGDTGRYNMFILTEYKYESYLQLAAKKNRKIFVANVNGDHDVLVIWKEVGIIFFQVKSNLRTHAGPTIVGDIRRALEQLLSDKFVFWQSNRDLSFISMIPIYCFIAEPFLEDSRLEDFNICTNHTGLILAKSVFESQGSFDSWMHRNITITSTFFPFKEEEYRLLVARYVGYLSLRTLPNPIKTAGELLQRVYLNPCQLELLKSQNKLQLLAGNYGTGKTLVLCSMANSILESKSTAFAHCITCSDISKDGMLSSSDCPFLSTDQMNTLLGKVGQNGGIFSKCFGQIYREANGGKHIPRPISITTRVFFDTLLTLVAGNERCKEQHILLDEVPFIIFENKEDARRCTEELSQALGKKSNIWISIASHTYKVNVFNCENPQEKLAELVPPQFNFCYLKYAMRVSQRQFDMIKEIEQFTGDGHHVFSEIGHVIKGPLPRLYQLAPCKCSLQESIKGATDKLYLPCDCSSSRLSDVFQIVFKFLEKNSKSDIVILIEYGVQGPLYNKMCEIVDSALQGENTNWVLAFKSKKTASGIRSSNTTNKLTVADGRTFRGCENRIVIVVDPFYMGQWFKTEGHVGVPTMVLTRCLSQYVHITWPKEECQEICKQALEGYDRMIQNIQGASNIWQNSLVEFVRQARNTMTNSQVTLLENLVQKRLIRDCRDESNA